ncbi:aminodeoxychorismate/anthranilate synthase component II [uncultured Sphaerochaeta sp.]|uniref:anthranilate synthase component II n=1 Tax=uncultured Sphaerochaeta sp. TaxID=886478 RepID=UPI002A0A5A5B|nr:aminodeoxychorismate/anthranilate synthase component II [uncultured Sphaerochaeta sp.]
MILLIDNYDSFSYNLFQLVGSMNPDIRVIRNDELSVLQIQDLQPERIIISPGPGKCEDAGVCIETIQKLGPTIPILGVCLGHQAICVAYGATVSHARHLMHGKQSKLHIERTCPLFEGLEDTILAARYHSLAAIDDTMPSSLIITSTSDDGQIMAVQHVEYPVYGVQFHPESIMTPQGNKILANFLRIGGIQ